MLECIVSDCREAENKVSHPNYTSLLSRALMLWMQHSRPFLLYKTVVLGQQNMRLITSYESQSTANNTLTVGVKCLLTEVLKKSCARTIPIIVGSRCTYLILVQDSNLESLSSHTQLHEQKDDKSMILNEDG